MNGKSKTISIVVIAVMLAAGIIGGITLFQQRGILPGISTNSSAGAGTLVLLLHDPPNVPPGVTAVYATYSGLAIHIDNDSSNSGWLYLNQQGTINLMSVVNFTQTIAKVQVKSGTFNLMRMNLSSVVVTYDSKNYTALVSNSEITVPIVNGLELENSATTGAVIDISPTILMTNASNNLSFTMVSSGKAFVVPQNQLSQSDEQIGYRESDNSHKWLTGEISQESDRTSLSITSASLSSSSLSVTVKNTGNASVNIATIFVSPNASDSERSSMGDIGNSILFGVMSNGSLVQFAGGLEGLVGDGPRIGYNLSAHSQATFTYSGSIQPTLGVAGGAGAQGEGQDTVSVSTPDVTETISRDAVTTVTSVDSHTVSESTGTGDHTTITQTSGVATSTTETHSTDSRTSVTQTDSLTGQSEDISFGFQVVAGQPYIIGVVSGDLTSMTSVIAS